VRENACGYASCSCSPRYSRFVSVSCSLSVCLLLVLFGVLFLLLFCICFLFYFVLVSALLVQVMYFCRHGQSEYNARGKIGKP
jgi:hypothetical protein